MAAAFLYEVVHAVCDALLVVDQDVDLPAGGLVALHDDDRHLRKCAHEALVGQGILEVGDGSEADDKNVQVVEIAVVIEGRVLVVERVLLHLELVEEAAALGPQEVAHVDVLFGQTLVDLRHGVPRMIRVITSCHETDNRPFLVFAHALFLCILWFCYRHYCTISGRKSLAVI